MTESTALRAVQQSALQPPTAPAVWARWVDAEGHRLVLRPLQPADALLLGALWDGALLPASRHNRFHGGRGRFTPLRLAEQSQLAPSRGVALVITRLLPGGEQMLAEGRWVRETSGPDAEFALSVADGWQGQGLGRRLLLALVQAAEHAQVQTLTAQVLVGNQAMQGLLRRGGLMPRADGAATGADCACLHYGCTPAQLHQRLLHQKPPAAAASPLRRAARWLASVLHTPLQTARSH